MTSRSVVVVDDVDTYRRLVKAALAADGRFRVVGEAADGDAAVGLAREHRPDLVLLDVSMPRRDGLEALPDILAASPGSRVVMLTGYSEGPVSELALARGAHGFLPKGLAPRKLVEALAAIVEGG